MFFHFYNKTNYESDPAVITVDEQKLKEMSLETIDANILASLLEELSGEEWTFDDADMTWDSPVISESETKKEIASNPADESGSAADESSEEASGSAAEDETSTEGGSDASETEKVSEESTTEGPTKNWYESQSQPTYEPVVPGTTSKVTNIMLIGIDETKAGNSDTMILLSINHTRHTITFTSFMRDIGITVPAVGFTKLNCAFAVGGGPLLVATIRANFGIDVNYYAWVSLDAMKSIVEIIGGLDLQLTEKEAKYCGIPEEQLDGTKVYHLTPSQTVTHCRDRSSGGNDYGRTDRQRQVLFAIIAKVRGGSLGSAASVANACLPYISHNIPAGTVASLLSQAPSLINYGINEQRIPYAGMYAGVRGYLVPDCQQTYKTWHTFVYGY